MKTIFIKKFNGGKTFFAVIGTTVVVLAVLVAIVAATKESCPFIYSYDGSQYVFDGEPYGGATMRSLARTDWSELEHLVPVHGEYRLALTNEVDETQHTDRLTLLAVDHPTGTTVVMDKQGRPHAFRRLEPLRGAHDENGTDMLRWLRKNDRAAWSPDIDALASAASLRETRNHITLLFRRPAGIRRAFLVSNAATGQWGSHMIRTMLSLRGDRVGDFYAAINGSDLYRRQLTDWNAREELFELFFEVRCGDRWVRQDYIPGAGPFISETRAIPIDLRGVTGDRVEIRIHPPIGFWSLNSFHLAWEEDSARVTRLNPRSARDQNGADVAALVTRDDGNCLDFPTKQDRALLVYDAPPATVGMKRTLFAETHGWYELHLHRPGTPDVAAIDSLTREPGYAVRRAITEFAEYHRTGKLEGVAADSAGVGGY